MPLVTVASNVPDGKFDGDFNMRFSKFLAEMLNKPLARIALHVTPGAKFTHGGTDDPACLIVVRSFCK